MNNPRITVIIPTRERCETLKASIRTCIEQDYDNLEIIVSDNASRDDTEAVVRSISDPRLRYIKTDRRLSMTGNYEFALAHVRPGFVTIIGDDDGLMPGAAGDLAKLVKEFDVKAVVGTRPQYFWPNYPVASYSNKLFLDIKNRPLHEYVDSRSEVASVVSFRDRGRGYYWGLAGVYTNFVATDVIESAIREGRYFHSMTPDAYSAFANSLCLARFLKTNKSLVMIGTSGKSIGASQVLGVNREQEKLFVDESDLSFHDDLCYAPSMAILMAEAYLQARSRFPDACTQHDFAVSRVCAAAVGEASGPNKDRVIWAVREIAAKHGIELSVAKPSIVEKLMATWTLVGDVYSQCEVDCTSFNVKDVYEASVLAQHLLAFRGGHGLSSGFTLVIRKLKQKMGYGDAVQSSKCN
jgi:glycosyltransferase involved in cell wall biosynthesis